MLMTAFSENEGQQLTDSGLKPQTPHRIKIHSCKRFLVKRQVKFFH